MEPLGAHQRLLQPAPGLALGALAALCMASLLELSRTLAEKFRGRWFAGNGRDVFHGAAAAAGASALLANGFPLPLACLATASALLFPLLLLDSLPPQRPARFALLVALLALALAPPLLEPSSVAEAVNLVARRLFAP